MIVLLTVTCSAVSLASDIVDVGPSEHYAHGTYGTRNNVSLGLGGNTDRSLACQPCNGQLMWRLSNATGISITAIVYPCSKKPGDISSTNEKTLLLGLMVPSV